MRLTEERRRGRRRYRETKNLRWTVRPNNAADREDRFTAMRILLEVK
jgi:hypothetical protein